MTAILGLLTLLKPILMPLMTFLAGWLMPSPIQKAANDQAKVQDAEKNAQDHPGNVGPLDGLP